MSALAWTCVGLGVLMVVTRAPLVVAPEATVAFLRKLLVSDAKIRGLGVVFALIGMLIVLGASGASETLALVISALGWLVIAISGGLLMIAPGVYRRIAEWVFESTSDLLRPLAALGVAIGIVLIALGLRLPLYPVRRRVVNSSCLDRGSAPRVQTPDRSETSPTSSPPGRYVRGLACMA